MSQTFSVYLLIALALCVANLPFVIEKPFLLLPWSQKGESPRPMWIQFFIGVLFFCVLAFLVWAVLSYLGSLSGLLANSSAEFMIKLLLALLSASILMSLPGWLSKKQKVQKNLFIRLLEVLVFYCLVGALGFAFESHIGNRFPQNWEFYVITLCLFLVMAYPGFVYRYLMRHPKGKFE